MIIMLKTRPRRLTLARGLLELPRETTKKIHFYKIFLKDPPPPHSHMYERGLKIQKKYGFEVFNPSIATIV